MKRTTSHRSERANASMDFVRRMKTKAGRATLARRRQRRRSVCSRKALRFTTARQRRRNRLEIRHPGLTRAAGLLGCRTKQGSIGRYLSARLEPVILQLPPDCVLIGFPLRRKGESQRDLSG